MSNWQDLESVLNDAVMMQFSETATFHFESGSRDVAMLPETQEESENLKGGGSWLDSNTTFLVPIAQAEGIVKDLPLTFREAELVVSKLPTKTDDGFLKLILTERPANESVQFDY